MQRLAEDIRLPDPRRILLEALQQVNKARPNTLSVQQFVDVKITELVSIFSPAPAEEQKQVYDLIKAISPISVSKLKDFAQK